MLDILFIQAKELFEYDWKYLTCYSKTATKLDIRGYYHTAYEPVFKLNIHFVEINVNIHNSEKEIIETFLHELVHAYEEENNLSPMEHSHHFLKWAVYFERLGYNILSSDCDLDELEKLYNQSKQYDLQTLKKWTKEKNSIC